jgi:hypothetical protein
VSDKIITGEIKVLEVSEHEDGSATLTIEMSEETRSQIFEFGFIQLIKKGLEGEDQCLTTTTHT